MIKTTVTKFKESNACKIKAKTTPKVTEAAIKKFFKKIFTVRMIAKNMEIKKTDSWVKFAWVIFSG